MTHPVDALAERLVRADEVTLAVGTAYVTGGSGLVAAVAYGPGRAAVATIALLSVAFLALLYASLTVVGRHG